MSDTLYLRQTAQVNDLRKIIKTCIDDHDRHESRQIEAREKALAAGKRLIKGGQQADGSVRITDEVTGDVLFEGPEDQYAGWVSGSEAEDLIHVDYIANGIQLDDSMVAGIPASLVEAVRGWTESNMSRARDYVRRTD